MSKQLLFTICFLFALLATSPEVLAQAVPPSGIIGWWAGDGDARDISSNGLHGGLFNGGAYAINTVGQGFDFVAGSVPVPSHLEVPDNAALRPAQFTVEVWIKFIPEFSNYHVAIAKGFASGVNDSYALGTSGIANPQFFTTHNGSTHVLAAPANLPNPNSWNHLAASYDGSTKRLYVNGVLVNSAFVGQAIDYDANPAPLTIGSDWENGVPQYHFNGFIDEATLYNHALADMEIAAIYNAGVRGKVKSASTTAGANSQTVVNDATITFQNVTATGTTFDYSIDPASAGSLPAGYTQTNLAYDISTTAAYNGAVNLCFHVPSINDVTVFSKLKVLHSEGGVLVDKTTTTNFPTRFVCGTVMSLSPFVIANGLSPTATDGTVDGRILDTDSNPVAGVGVRMSGTQNHLTVTDAQGHYRFDNVEAGGFYTIIPSRANFTFSPAQRSFSQLGQHTDAGFSASSTGDLLNPLAATEYFVRQQYLDFLEREPDQSGFEYWSEQINSCNGDAACVQARRLNVSAAFFLEREFQESGAYVYRLYKAAYGEQENYRPAFVPFMADRARVVGGANLAQGKLGFANLFVARADFRARYPETMTAAHFVDAVLQTVQQGAGLTFDRGQRESFINDVNTGGRGQMMRNLADAGSFAQAPAVYNRTFVLMQYFVYLRRDPEVEGYNFWVNIMNNVAPGNYRGMVCAFITSAEYQNRFSAVVSHSNRECSP